MCVMMSEVLYGVDGLGIVFGFVCVKMCVKMDV